MTGGRPAKVQRKGLVPSTPLARIVARFPTRNRALRSQCRRALGSAEDSQRRCRCLHSLCRRTSSIPMDPCDMTLSFWWNRKGPVHSVSGKSQLLTTRPLVVYIVVHNFVIIRPFMPCKPWHSVSLSSCSKYGGHVMKGVNSFCLWVVNMLY